TSAPYAAAMEPKRSPKEPMETESTLSPGLSVFTTAASRPPVPEVEIERMSDEDWKTQLRPAVTRRRMLANSGPRWFIIWRAPACRTSSGQGVGPGIRRFTQCAPGEGGVYGVLCGARGQPRSLTQL